MGLLTKTKEYMIRIFDYTIAKCRITTQKSTTQIAMAAFFLANKFEGDHNFDYRLFRRIIDRFEIAFFEIQLAECKIVQVMDLSIFNQAPVFDFIRAVIDRLEVEQKVLVDGYYRYMDNTYIYILMTDQYKYDIMLVCMVLTLTYFTAKSCDDIARQIYKLIASVNKVDKDYLKKLDNCKAFVLKKLKDLGSKDTEVEFLDKEIDFEKYMGHAFKVSLLVD